MWKREWGREREREREWKRIRVRGVREGGGRKERGERRERWKEREGDNKIRDSEFSNKRGRENKHKMRFSLSY
jgi:hypothetical protein